MDFNYGNKVINASGPIKPADKNMPGDPRTRVETYADIASIPTPYIGMTITVLVDETNENKMTDYKVKSLKANSSGVANSLVDEVVRYVDYLGAASGGGSSSGGTAIEIVDDLTTGGVDKALSAEQGKVIKASLDNIKTNFNDHLANHSTNGGLVTKVLTVEEITQILGATPTPPPSEIVVTSVVASSNYLSLNIGETRRITATVYPSNATNKTITYSSSNSSVVSVDQQGNITANAVGDILITLTAHNGVSTDCQVIVNEVQETINVTDITLDKTTITNLNVGETSTITATVIPTNATNKSIVWSSSDNNIATVDNGVVTGVNDGSCTITCASVENNTIKTTCSVTVKTVVGLTSVTNGLVHSYDFTNLVGTSNNIDDSTGNVPCTLSGFSDVQGAKTSLGVKCETSSSKILQGNLLSNYNGVVTIVSTFIGKNVESQGYYYINGVKLCKHNGVSLSYTHSSFLDNSFSAGCHNENTYSTFVSQFDFNNSKIITYVNGVRVKEIPMDDKVIWGNELRLFDGYSTNNNALLTVKNLCVYDRLLSDSECLQVHNDLTNGNRYTTLNPNNSTLTNKNNVIFQLGDTSILEGNTLNNIVGTQNDVITNISSLNSEGFIVSDYATFKQQPTVNNTVLIKFKHNIANKSEQYLSYDSNDVRVYISNDKLYIRGISIWYVNGVSVQLNNGYNIIRVENSANSFDFYLNGTLLTMTQKDTVLFKDRLYNKSLPIKDFIIIDKFLNEGEKAQLKIDLGGDV